MKTKALDRGERKRTVLIWFAIRIQHDNLEYATSYAIAKGLGLSASSKFRLILKEMCEDGLLKTESVQKIGRWKGSGYMLADGTYERPSRTIKVKQNGVQKGQLRLI